MNQIGIRRSCMFLMLHIRVSLRASNVNNKTTTATLTIYGTKLTVMKGPFKGLKMGHAYLRRLSSMNQAVEPGQGWKSQSSTSPR